ncbi:hypothetical protein NPIL_369601 [Nephila pilipes]|uniref:Uncharacterized protein n=1 Tax=Nephila pilipes TaxID=299642 RepID=A0A8X6PUX8_NEPPI|nr:hypothetical protein NPIL_369601 [Nephila pilipes]
MAKSVACAYALVAAAAAAVLLCWKGKCACFASAAMLLYGLFFAAGKVRQRCKKSQRGGSSSAVQMRNVSTVYASGKRSFSKCAGACQLSDFL